MSNENNENTTQNESHDIVLNETTPTSAIVENKDDSAKSSDDDKDDDDKQGTDAVGKEQPEEPTQLAAHPEKVVETEQPVAIPTAGVGTIDKGSQLPYIGNPPKAQPPEPTVAGPQYVKDTEGQTQ